MNRRVAVIGIILTGVLTILGCVLVIGGFGAALLTVSRTGAQASVPGGPKGEQDAIPAGGSVRIGAAAPEFTLTSLDKATVELGQFRGKVVLLNFWATWCGPCSAEMPNIEQVYQGLSHEEVAILAVNQGEFADQVSGYADLYHLHFPILLDSHTTIGNMFRVQALPTTVFIDRSGIIREIHIGGPMSQEFIQSHLQTLLRQSP